MANMIITNMTHCIYLSWALFCFEKYLIKDHLVLLLLLLLNFVFQIVNMCDAILTFSFAD